VGEAQTIEGRPSSLLVVLVVGALLLNDSRGDTVEITLTVNGDATSTTSGILLEDTDLLEGLEDLSSRNEKEVDESV